MGTLTDDLINDLISKGYSTGSLSDRQLAFLTSKSGGIGSVNDKLTALGVNKGLKPFREYLISEGALPLSYLDLPTSGIKDFHRASGAVYTTSPENSMTAIAEAITLGADIVDIDAQLTSDGVLVSIHDTTVDRVTEGTGAVNSFTAASLPQLNDPTVIGSGWALESIPTIAQILDTFGGAVLITIEVKNGIGSVVPLANMIKARSLEDSVYINHNTPAVISAITAEGCLAHMYGVTTSVGISDAVTAGAKLIELPYNAAPALVNEALASGIHRVIGSPVGKRTEESAVTAGLQGFVIDSPNYVARSSGANRSRDSILSSIVAGKTGAGWYRTGAVSNWIEPNALRLQSGAATKVVMLGDVSGNTGVSGKITSKFKMPVLPTTTSQSFRARVMCPEESVLANNDALARGYVLSLRANGQINLWSAPVGYGGGAAVGLSPIGAALVAGNEYTLEFEWTATQVRLSCVETAITTGWVNNTAWRNGHNYVFTTMTTGELVVTEFKVENV